MRMSNLLVIHRTCALTHGYTSVLTYQWNVFLKAVSIVPTDYWLLILETEQALLKGNGNNG